MASDFNHLRYQYCRIESGAIHIGSPALRCCGRGPTRVLNGTRSGYSVAEPTVGIKPQNCDAIFGSLERAARLWRMAIGTLPRNITLQVFCDFETQALASLLAHFCHVKRADA